MIRIITDSASDITLQEAKEMDIRIVPLHIRFTDGECPQETIEDFARFYEWLEQAQELPKTSQPSPEDYLSLFEEAKQENDEALVLTLSGGLSGTVQAAGLAKEICGYDKIYIVDSRQAIIAQRMLVEHALKLRREGTGIQDMVEELETLRDRITVSGIVDTLTYLKKGGRIPAALALLGNTLKIKPVIVLEDTVLKMIGKALGRKAGKKLMYERFEKYEPDPDYPIYFAYSSNREMGKSFMEETIEKYGLQHFKTGLYPAGGVIGTHVGTNCVALAYVIKMPAEHINSEKI